MSAAPRTLGVDLSVDPEKTAIATVGWAGGGARVERVEHPAGDDALAAAVRGAVEGGDPCGIDSPLGWPRRMAAAVAAHAVGRSWEPLTKDEFRYRRTDLAVVARTRAWETTLHPLSVAADRIAMPAWRIAEVRERVHRETGRRFDLAGDDGVFEVYPAAALVRWGLSRRGYKASGEAGRERRAALIAELDERSGWLGWEGGARAACVDSDDCFDAVIAALVTRAAAGGDTFAPSAEEADDAAAEGWIHLPEVSLDRLPG